jgi:hypothetical protein
MGRKTVLFVLALIASSSTAAGAYRFSLTENGSPYPVIEGMTDAPNGTMLLVIIKNPWLPDANARLARGLAACGDDCLPAIDSTGMMGGKAIVKDGHFSVGPFSFAGKPIPPNTYPVEISLSVDVKTAPVERLKDLGKPLFSGQLQIGTERTASMAQNSENRGLFYEARYQLVGYLIRAGNVCNASKEHIEATFSLLEPDELKTFSRSFPEVTKQWMTRGAELFNSSVMQVGIPAACDHAFATLKKATAQ